MWIKKTLVLLMVYSLMLASQPAFAADPVIVKRGYNYIKRGYIKNAIPTFKRAVKLYPSNVRANLGLALSADKQGGKSNFDLAIKYYEKTLELDPNNYQALTNLARILSWQQSTRSRALNLYQKAYALKPADANNTRAYAEVLVWEGKNQEAIDILNPFVTSMNNDKKLTLIYANALSSNGNYQNSLKYYNNLLASKYKMDDLSFAKYAVAMINSGEEEEGIKIFDDLIVRVKDQPLANNIKKEYASVLFDLCQYQKAIEIDDNIDPKTKDVFLRLARSNAFIGNDEKAFGLFEKIYNDYPNDIEMKRAVANYLGNLGNYNLNAIKLYEEILDSGEATLDDKVALANLYTNTDDSKFKGVTILRSVDQNSLSFEEKTKLNRSLAVLLASLETTRPESIEIYRDLVKLDPNNLDLKLELLEVLSWQDVTRYEALVEYFDLVGLYPANQNIVKGFNDTLSWYSPQGEDLALYEQIIARYPNNVNALKGLAAVVSKNPANHNRAVAIYEQLLVQDPDNYDIKVQMARLLASNAKTRSQAISLLEDLNRHDPNNIELKAILAENLLYKKKFKDAKRIFNEILDVSPDDKEALLGLARIYAWQGLNIAAYKAYEKVYEKYSYDPDIAYEFADVAKKLGNNGKALEILQQIKGKSELPDVPNLPIVAMAINYQATSIDLVENSDFDIDQIEKELSSLQASLDKLENEINNFETVQTNTVSSDVIESVPSIQSIEQENPSGYDAVILSEVTPLEYNHNLSVELNEPDDSYMKPAVMVSSDKQLGEMAFSPKQNNEYFRRTGFQDALAGRLPRMYSNQFDCIEDDIMYQMRPELRTSFMFSNEQGDPTSDALEMHGYPTFMSVNITPQNRFRFGITSTTYGMTTSVHPASITGTAYTMGLNSVPHQRVNFDGQLTINNYSDPNAPVDVTARTKLTLKLHDRLDLNLGYRREPLYQSVFETAGYTLQPQYSYPQLLGLTSAMSNPLFYPNATGVFNSLNANPDNYNNLRGPFMGQVRDNAVNVEVNYRPFNKWDVNAGYEYSSVRGENIQNNGRHQANFSFGRSFTGVKNHIFRLGYQFLFFGYRRDLSGFPAMSPYPIYENGSPVGVARQLSFEEAAQVVSNRFAIPSDIWNDPTGATVTRYISPIDVIRAPRGVGIGGYYSPTQFYLNSFRFDFEGKLGNRVSYKGGASLGVQQAGDRVSRGDLLAARGLEQFANVAPNDPRRAFPAFNANAIAAESIQDSTDPTTLASAFDLTLFLKLTDFLTLYSGVDYLNAGAYNRWAYNGGLIIRPSIDALTPIFRKPSSK